MLGKKRAVMETTREKVYDKKKKNTGNLHRKPKEAT